MHWKYLLVFTLSTLLYIVLGGVCFHFLERSTEEDTTSSTQEAMQQFLNNNTCITAAELQALISAVIQAYDSGVLVVDNSTDPVSNWEIPAATFFSWTVITTIGYGHVSPSTTGGRLFFAIYAIIGIPLFGLMLTGWGERYSKLQCKITDKMTKDLKKKAATAVRIIFTVLVVFIFCLLIPAAIFDAIEGWGYGTAVYYCLVTITTIGFGDYVAGTNFQEGNNATLYAFYRMSLVAWILFGLVVCASTLGDIGNLMQTQEKKDEEKMEAEKAEGGEEKEDKKGNGNKVAPVNQPVEQTSGV